MEGHKGEQSDAPKAYTQCPMLRGLEVYKEQTTWVSLERGQWPKSWKGMTDLVCPLERALYGHPLAGAYWEHLYIDVAVYKCGVLPIPGWECLFDRPELQTLLSLFVDDLKVAGPNASVDKTEELLRKHLKLDDPTSFGRYPGCEQHELELSSDQSRQCLKHMFPLVF